MNDDAQQLLAMIGPIVIGIIALAFITAPCTMHASKETTVRHKAQMECVGACSQVQSPLECKMACEVAP